MAATALRPGMWVFGRWTAATTATAMAGFTGFAGLRCDNGGVPERRRAKPPSHGAMPATAALPPTLPKVQGPKSAPELIFDTLTRQRVVYLCGAIDDQAAKTIIAQLLVLESTDPGAPITMYITSSGGKVWAGMGILDMMDFITSPVSTVVVGHASSMAAIISSAGEPGRRYALPNSCLMVHEPRHSSGREDRRVEDLEVSAKQLRSTRDLTVRTLTRCTGRSPEEVERLLEKDTYCSPEEAKTIGLVDHVVRHIAELQVGREVAVVSGASASSGTAAVAVDAEASGARRSSPPPAETSPPEAPEAPPTPSTEGDSK